MHEYGMPLLLLAVPVTTLSNVLRIASLFLFASWFGQPLAMTLWHEIAGGLVYAVAIALLCLIASSLVNNRAVSSIRTTTTTTN